MHEVMAVQHGPPAEVAKATANGDAAGRAVHHRGDAGYIVPFRSGQGDSIAGYELKGVGVNMKGVHLVAKVRNGPLFYGVEENGLIDAVGVVEFLIDAEDVDPREGWVGAGEAFESQVAPAIDFQVSDVGQIRGCGQVAGKCHLQASW